MTAFLPEAMPAAGICSSVADDRHQYPYSRDDDEVFVSHGDTPDRADRRQYHHIRERIHGSEDMRMLLAGKIVNAQNSHIIHGGGGGGGSRPENPGSKKMVKPPYLQASTGDEAARLAKSRNRRTYDNASFCTDGPYRRIKSGPGWEGSEIYQTTEGRSVASLEGRAALYSTHRFHLKAQQKPSVRAGTDAMMRTLGYDHVADMAPAGASSDLANRWIKDEVWTPRGPAMTVNSHLMRPDRNIITGHNLGESYTYTPGERAIPQQRMGKATNSGLLNRKGFLDHSSHNRIFGEKYKENEAKSQGVRVGLEPSIHSGRLTKESIFPRATQPIDVDRRNAEAAYKTELWAMHETLPGYGEARRIKEKYSL